MFGSLPALALLAWFLLARQWVRWLGRPAMATVLKSERYATLPYIITQVTLEFTPIGDPEYVRIRRLTRWSEHIIHPDCLAPGAQLRVRYRLARSTIVMPDARSR